MKFLTVTLLLASLIALCSAYVQITDENFSELVQQSDEWIIDFYADWCGYCKRIEPKFQAADRFIGMSSHKHVKLGAVNIETNPGLAARFFISRLPTLVHIKDHEVRVMPHPKSENDIVSFVTMEEWREVSPKAGFMSPFSLFGKIVGFTGKMIKKLSNYSPWTMIGVLTGFLICALGLPIYLSKGYSQEADKKVEDNSIEHKTESVSTGKKSPNTSVRRKSKRIE